MLMQVHSSGTNVINQRKRTITNKTLSIILYNVYVQYARKRLPENPQILQSKMVIYEKNIKNSATQELK